LVGKSTAGKLGEGFHDLRGVAAGAIQCPDFRELPKHRNDVPTFVNREVTNRHGVYNLFHLNCDWCLAVEVEEGRHGPWFQHRLQTRQPQTSSSHVAFKGCGLHRICQRRAVLLQFLAR
jgi:hypothetical protein